MRIFIISTALVTLVATPLTVSAQSGSGAVPGAVGGAAAGAAVGGPVGAAVGGVAGAAVGGALTADQSTKVKTYVAKEKRSSVKVTEKVAVGETLPSSVQFEAVIPADVGVQTQYRYTVVNDRTVLVHPGTRRVIQVIDSATCAGNRRKHNDETLDCGSARVGARIRRYAGTKRPSPSEQRTRKRLAAHGRKQNRDAQAGRVAWLQADRACCLQQQ